MGGYVLSLGDVSLGSRRYLPESHNGKRILVPQHGERRFLVDNSQLGADVCEIAFRKSRDLQDRDELNGVAFGETVTGDLLDGWLEVDLGQLVTEFSSSSRASKHTLDPVHV